MSGARVNIEGGSSMSKCYVTAVISPKLGMENRVEAEILSNIPLVREERGCLRYDLHVQKRDGVKFLFYEIWEDLAALDAHLKTPHMLAYQERTKDMLAAPAQVDTWSGVNVVK
jgi:quinol monooxygenase YgiN